MSNENNNAGGQEPNAQEELLKLQEQVKTLESEKLNLVDEIKNDRTKRQELQEEIDKLNSKIKDVDPKPPVNPVNPDSQQVDVATQVQQELAKIESAKAKANQASAVERFITTNKIYSPDSDPSGLKAEALRKQLSRFNTEGLTSVDEFEKVIKDADRLLRGGDDNHSKIVNNPDDASLPQGGGDSEDDKSSKLSDKEKALIERNGMTEEKFLSLKTSQPGMIEDLLRQL